MFYKYCYYIFVIFFYYYTLKPSLSHLKKRISTKTMQIYFIRLSNFKWTQDLRPQHMNINCIFFLLWIQIWILFVMKYSQIYWNIQIFATLWTDERPRTDHVTSGPMRDLGKKCTRWQRQPHTRTWHLYDWIGPMGTIQWKTLLCFRGLPKLLKFVKIKSSEICIMP